MLKQTTLEEGIKDYQQYELQAHVSQDDVLNKVTQEVGEMIEAKSLGRLEETRKEAADSIVNILSASASLGVYPTEENLIFRETEVDAAKLMIALSKRNQQIQGYRKRYSRDTVSVEAVKLSTEAFLSDIMTYSDMDKSLMEIVQGNAAKFASRVEAYKPDINFADYIENFPGFPKPGIQFKDVGDLLWYPEIMRVVAYEIANRAKDADILVGLESRGFLFGPLVSQILNKPFVMARKEGKLPGDNIQQAYTKEYGTDIIEVQKKRIHPRKRVAIIDDLLATGGTMNAAATLIEKAGGEVVALVNVIQLNDGFCASERENLKLHENYNVDSIVHYDN